MRFQQKQHRHHKQSTNEVGPLVRDVRDEELSEDTETVLDEIDEVLEDEV